MTAIFPKLGGLDRPPTDSTPATHSTVVARHARLRPHFFLGPILQGDTLFKKIIAGAGIALVALFAAPMAAQAYGADENISVSGDPQPGETITVTFDEYFTGGEDVSFALTGENAEGATLAVFKAAVNTQTLVKSADASGSVALDVTLPTNATGTYTVTATGLESGIVGTAAITVVAADGSGSGSGDDDGLAVTGGTALTAIWIAGGALALGVALLLIRTMRRKASV